MKIRNWAVAALTLAGALALSATAANAATVVFDFGVGPNGVVNGTWAGDQGQSKTYTASGLSLTASAFGPSAGGFADHLYGKNFGGDENGLGMTNDPTGEHEIYFGKGFIQLNVSGLAGDSLSVNFGSTTSGEKWEVFGTNTAGTIGSTTISNGHFIGDGTGEGGLGQALTGGWTYYDIVSEAQAGGQNVLLTSLTATSHPVPEPAAWGLMIMGVFCIGAAMRQRRQSPDGAFRAV
jgi:hypothetical protein